MATQVFKILQKLRLSLQLLESRLWGGYGGYPPLGPALAVQGAHSAEDAPSASEGDIGSIFDGILWAVPKHRRSIQRNRIRRRAEEKMIKYIPKEKFTTCQVCGRTKMIGFLCGHCLITIRQETEEIKKRLFSKLEEAEALPEKETVVVYEDEAPRPEDGGKQIIDIKKKRPSWFSQALTE